MEIRKMFRAPAGATETVEQVNEFARRFHNVLDAGIVAQKDAIYEQLLEKGMRGDWLEAAYTTHAARRGAVPGRVVDEQAARMNSQFPHALHRKGIYDVPEGTATLNQIVTEAQHTRPVTRATAKLMENSPHRHGKFFQMDLVRAADRENYGRILGFNTAKDEALVHFVSPEGAMADVHLPMKSLTKVERAALVGDELLPNPVYTREEQLRQMVEELKVTAPPRPGYEIPTNPHDIRVDHLFHTKLAPAFEREWARGVRPAAGGKRPWLAENMAEDVIKQRELDRLWRGVGEVFDADGNVIAEAAPSVAEALVDDMIKRPSVPGGLFNKLMVEDHGQYMEMASERLHTLQVQRNFLHGVVETAPREGTVPLSEAWASITSKAGGKGRPALTARGLETFVEEYAQKNGLAGAVADELFVPEQTAKALQGFQDLIEPGTHMRSQFGKMYDMWTAAVKGGWTLPWPAFHSRNRLAGWFQNRVADVPWQTRSLGDWEGKIWKWLRGKGEFEYASEIVPSQLLKHGRAEDIGAEAAQELGHVAGGGYGWIFQRGPHRTWNPLKIRGMDEAWGLARPATDAPQFIPMAIGERAYSYVETMNRLPLYAEARANGLSMAQAKALVDRVQYDYARMTPFENRVMRRFVFPFYGWLKNNTIYHAGELMQNPGGRLGSSIRMASQTGRMTGGQMPRWLQEQMAVPMPGGSERETTILRQFGLPFEDLKTVQGTAGRTIGRLIGQTHPAISTAFKLYGNTDPHTGRQIKHMEGPSHYLSSAGIPTLDAMFQATPLSRAFWSYKTLTDQRKHAAVRGLDLLTGLKLATYDMPRLLAQDTAKAYREELERNPYIWQGDYPFIPAHLKEKAGPEGQKKLRVARALAKEATELKQFADLPKKKKSERR
jgi:hypothetical protein